MTGFAVTAAGYLRGSAPGGPRPRHGGDQTPRLSTTQAPAAARSRAVAWTPANAQAPAAERSFTPLWSGQLELTSPSLPAVLTDSGQRPLQRARILFRAAGTPLGFIELDTPDGRVVLDHAVELAQRSFGAAASDAADDASWAQANAAPVSVVLCTHNRSDGVARTLASLLELRHAWLEVIVVDNAPLDDSTRVLVERIAQDDPRVRYVREDRKGLSCARNRGLREARGTYVAFTDDDVRVDPLWVNGLMRGFARDPGVACVTGLVASASLERPAEQYFDRRVWWSSSCAPRLFTAERRPGDSPLHPFTTGIFGTGANFAADVSVLRSLGGFDECLGAGSPTQGGEDLDIFVRLVTAGHALSYEPSALVWHEHRVDSDSLQRQMYAYGLGLTAYLTKCVLGKGTRAAFVRRIPGGVVHALSLLARSRAAAQGSSLAQRGMADAEVRGMLAGPFVYLGVRWRADPDHLRSVSA